jgi:hypothetical protein
MLGSAEDTAQGFPAPLSAMVASGSIAGHAYDRLWFGAGAAVVSIGFVFASHVWGAGATLALYVAFNALFNLPHQYCTWVRAFGEDGPVPRGRWVLAAGIVLIVAVLARAVPGARALLLINFLPYWGLWHLCAQHYGLTRIYRRKTPGDTVGSRTDRVFFLILFALGLLRLHAATDLTFRVAGSITTMWRLPLGPALAHGLPPILTVVFVIVCVARLWPAWRSNPTRARFEGLVAAATFVGFFGTDNILITTAAITSLHNVHYIGLVRFYRATRARTDAATAPLGWRSFLAAYLYSGVVHGVFLVSMFAGEALLASLVAFHYVVDTRIWRFRQQPALSGYLGLARLPS